MDDDNDQASSMERAVADVEMLCAAYPDEVAQDVNSNNRSKNNNDNNNDSDNDFLCVTLQFSSSAKCQLQILWKEGYPGTSNVQIASYRCSPTEKICMETAMTAIRSTAQQCLEDGMEGCLPCVSAALQAWQEGQEEEEALLVDQQQQQQPGQQGNLAGASHANLPLQQQQQHLLFDWYTSQPVVVQKSTFVGHACHIDRAFDVPLALDQLIRGNSKLLRATHNMVRIMYCT